MYVVYAFDVMDDVSTCPSLHYY